MQFAENFHQAKPEPVQFARAARAIMAEDPSLTAAEVSRLVGAPLAWTRKSLKLLDLPENVVKRVEEGDLSFTVADVVRRGIARGDVSAEEASALVEQAPRARSPAGAEARRRLRAAQAQELRGGVAQARRGALGGQPREGLAKDADAEQRDWSRRRRRNGSRAARSATSDAPRIVA